MTEYTDMSRRQVEARMKSVEDELERLREADEERGLDDTDDTYFNQLVSEHEELRGQLKRKQREERMEQVREQANNPRSRVRGSYPNEDEAPAMRDSVPERRFRDPYDLSEIRPSLTPEQRSAELHARALTAIEKMPLADDKRKEAMTHLVERYDDAKRSALSQLVLATSSEQYVRAFERAVAANGDLSKLPEESRETMTRAMSTTDSDGGFLIPFQLDPSIINTADGSFNPVRQLARNVVATGNEWHGVSSDGVTGRWAAEGTESTDGAPTLAQPSVPLHKLDIFVPISIEASQDASNVASEIAQMIAFEKDVLESVAFVTGNGTNKPTGIITELTGTASEIETSGALAESDVFDVDNALPMRYNVRAQWLANKAIYNEIRSFSSADSMWNDISNGVPAELLGHQTNVAEAMDGSVETGTGSTSKVLVLGDWSNYVVADRVGTAIEYVPHIFGANGRPTGQRGWYAYARVGGRSVNNGAFRMLDKAS